MSLSALPVSRRNVEKRRSQVRHRVVSSIASFALSLSLLTVMTVVTAPPASAITTGTGSGLFALIKNGVGDYGSIPTDMKFSDRCGSTILATVDFDWTSAMPTGATDCGTQSGAYRINYSAMITGYLLAPATGSFTFKSRSDDGFVVNVNGQTVISSWAAQGAAAAPNFNTNNASSASMSLVEGNIYPIRIFFSQGAGAGEAHLFWNYGSSGDQVIPQSNLGLTASDLGTGCAVGESQFCPADNARQIKALNGTTSNQKWWINVGGVSTNTYALMDSNIDGGGWMMGMKGLTNAQGNSTALGYDATQWTTTTTLQAGSDNNAPLASDNANAKNNVFNYSAATEALVIWRDLTGRSDGYRYTNAGTYGFTWKESLTSSTGWSNALAGGVNSSGGCPTTAVTLLTLFANANRCKLRDANSSSPYDARGNVVFSSQNQINFYGFNYYGSGPTPYQKVRFGFGWNENAAGNESSNDVNGGIGMGGSIGGWAAGDFISCCQTTTGINRQAGYEFYVRNSALTISGTSSVTAVAGTASNPWTVSSASASTGASAARYIVKTRTPGVNTSAITINNSGVMSVSTALNGGTYSLSVSMIDTYGQVASTPVTLTVADANLTSLSISSGTLSPDFASATTSYTATVAHTVSSITATPTAVKSNATYKTNVNSAGLSSAINSGTTSGSLAINYGSNTILIVVTDVNGTTTKTYTLTVTRETAAPGAPTLGSATVTNATTVSLPFTAPAANGSAITSYTITSSPSLALTYSGTSSPFTVTGSFVQGQAYTFTMTATNGAGTSTPSSASNSITPNAAAAPGAPTLGSATVTNATTVSLPFTAPAANGSAITSYTITSSPSIALTYSGTSSPFTVTGSFVQGQAYTFTMTATNGAGTSTPSSASNSVMPNNILTITYAAGTSGSGSAPTSPTTVAFGTTFTTPVNTYTRTGYTFAGWSDGSATYVAAATYPAIGTVSGNVTLTATWSARTDNGIAYNNQGATTAQSGGSTTYTTAAAITTIPTTAPLKDGFAFKGWYTSSSGGTQVTDGSYTPASPFGTVTLYAQWNSTNARLSAITLSSGTLSPIFASGTFTYTASVANTDATGFTVTATKGESNASVVQYLGATGSFAFTGSLSIGANIIRTIVTAQDGLTTVTYTLTVTRAATPPITSVIDPSAPLVALTAINTTFLQTNPISARVNTPSKVTFLVNNKAIPGCSSIKTVSASSTHTATCNYRPTSLGSLKVSATITPNSSNFLAVTTTIKVTVRPR